MHSNRYPFMAPYRTFGKGRDNRLDDHIESIPFDTEPVKKLKLEKRGTVGPFVKGPVALSWIKACQTAHPAGLALALGIKARTGCFPDGRVPVGNSLARLVGLGEDTRARALAALEAVGLVEVVRASGRVPVARLTPWPRPDDNRNAGDIDMAPFAGVDRLGGQSNAR